MRIAPLILWLIAPLSSLGLAEGAEFRLKSSAPVQQASPTDDELLEAWLGLSDEDKNDTIEWFTAECDNATHFRATLERFVLVNFEGDPRACPAAEAPPTFDPSVHTPAQIIRRVFVDPSRSGHSVKVRKLRGVWNEREMEAAYRYDWALGSIVSIQAWDHPERIARTAIAGFSPNSDLVEAIVEMQLDRGEVRDVAAAFGHAYSDRSGNAYRSVTLYEAWASGQSIEMPDVECLGIVHTLEDDWKTYVAPVPGRQHKALYQQIGEHFAPLRRYRALRTSLARLFLQGSARLPSGYEATALRLHGFWELQTSEPLKMRDFLPAQERTQKKTQRTWDRWWKSATKKVDKSKSVRERAAARMKALDESRAWTRRTFHGILKEYGAFEKGD